MKKIVTILAMFLASAAYCQEDSTRVRVTWGSENGEMNELYGLLKIDHYKFRFSDEKLKNRKIVISYAEYKGGKLVMQSSGSSSPAHTLYRQTDTAYLLKVFAHKTAKDSAAFLFKFPRMGMEIKFKTLETSDYSLRDAASSLGKQFSYVPIGKKIPFLVYSLPYEDKKRPGSKLYCSLTNNAVAPEKWGDVYGVAHYIIFYLEIIGG